MNGRVGNREVAEAVEEWGVDEIYDNGEHLVDVCAERGLVLVNTFLDETLYRSTWTRRDERNEQQQMRN